MQKKQPEKGTTVYWNRGGENILSYVDFTILCIVISLFQEFSIDILTNNTNYPLSYIVQETLNGEKTNYLS